MGFLGFPTSNGLWEVLYVRQWFPWQSPRQCCHSTIFLYLRSPGDYQRPVYRCRSPSVLLQGGYTNTPTHLRARKYMSRKFINCCMVGSTPWPYRQLAHLSGTEINRPITFALINEQWHPVKTAVICSTRNSVWQVQTFDVELFSYSICD